MEEWLRGCLGVTKIPLAYVIRREETIPVEDPVGGYATLQDELIAPAPIRDNTGAYIATYLTDHAKVWEKISSLT
jgi:hypothetical protein